MTNEIIIFEDKRQVTSTELFTKNGIDSVLKEIREKASSIVQDVTTEAGRKQIASTAYKVAKTKTTLDNLGKELTEDWARQKSLVDIERKKVREELDALRDEIRKPLNEFEEKEKERVYTLQLRYDSLDTGFDCESSERIKISIGAIKNIYKFDWQEFAEKAKERFEEKMVFLNEKLKEVTKREEDAIELKRLQEAEESRKIKENEERIARESAEKARLEAEEKAQIEKERIEQEQKRKDEEALRVKQQAELEAKQREAKLDAEKKQAEEAKLDAERRVKEAEAKAKQDKIDAIKALEQVEAKAELDKENAIKAEREKVEAQKKSEAEELAKREANKNHKIKIHNEIIQDLSKIAISDAETYYKAIITAIAKGKIRNLLIKY